MTELVVGKYKFYPYEFDKDKTPDLEEIVRRLEKEKRRKRVSKDKLAPQKK